MTIEQSALIPQLFTHTGR